MYFFPGAPKHTAKLSKQIAQGGPTQAAASVSQQNVSYAARTALLP
jgi:hypothetical protein